MQAISFRKLKRRLPRVLTVEEVQGIIAAARNPWERACVEVLYATGVRFSELVNIRLENIIFPGRMILIENGKGGKDRWVLYGQAAAKAIAEYQEWRPSIAPAKNGDKERFEIADVVKSCDPRPKNKKGPLPLVQ